MWTIRHSSGNLIHISPDTSITIGRKACDLLLHDPTVSKVHASVRVKYTREDDNQPGDDNSTILLSTCIITDEGSTRGTKIIRNDKKISLCPGKGYALKPDDKIKFGTNNIWTVSYREISLLTCGDCLDYIQKLNAVIKKLGGRIFTEWHESCNFYSTICGRVTTKFGIALAAGLPIVTLKYWEDCYESFETRKEFPDSSLYFITNWDFNDELKNVSLQPKIERRLLFAGLEFVFFSSFQISYYAQMIELAGGRPLMYSKYGFGKNYLTDEKTIVVACNDPPMTCNDCCGVSQDGYREIRRLLAKVKRIMVVEMDIIKAIMMCSRKKYCNPDPRRKSREKFNEDLEKHVQSRQGHQSHQVQAVSNGELMVDQSKSIASASVEKSPDLNKEIAQSSTSTLKSALTSTKQLQKRSVKPTKISRTPRKLRAPEESPVPSSKAEAVQDSGANNQPSTSKHVLINDEKMDEVSRRPRLRSRTSKSKSPAPVQLPEVTVQLERLSDEVIQAATQTNHVETTKDDENLNDSRSSEVINSSLNEGNNHQDVNSSLNEGNDQQDATNSNLDALNGRNLRKRKRKTSLANRDSTPDLFSSGDESPTNKKQSTVKIVDDRVIESRIILKTSKNTKAKKRKVDAKITPKASAQGNKITNYFVENHVGAEGNVEEETRAQSSIFIDEDETNDVEYADDHRKTRENEEGTLVISDDETNSGEINWIETKPTKVITEKQMTPSSKQTSTPLSTRKRNVARQKLIRLLDSDSDNVNRADDSLISIGSDNSDSIGSRLVINEDDDDDAVNNGLEAIQDYVEEELAEHLDKAGLDQEKESGDQRETLERNRQQEKTPLKASMTNEAGDQDDRLTPRLEEMKRVIRGIFSSGSDDDHSEASTETVKITSRRGSRADADDNLEMVSDDNEGEVGNEASEQVSNEEIGLENVTPRGNHQRNQRKTPKSYHGTDSQRRNVESPPPKSQPILNMDVTPKRTSVRPKFSSLFGDNVKKPQVRNNNLENNKRIGDDKKKDDDGAVGKTAPARTNEKNNDEGNKQKVITSNNIFSDNAIPLFLMQDNNNKNDNKDDNNSTDVWPTVLMEDDDLLSVMNTVEITTEDHVTLSSGTEGSDGPQVQKKVDESAQSSTNRNLLSENALPSFFSNIL